jgi:hypothetical protein
VTSFLLQVLSGTLASQYFVPGDIVLGIQGYSARDLLHMEATDLIRQPVKSLELLVQKTEHIPPSIWGPEPVLKRPSEWLRRSPAPAPDAHSKLKAGYRPASVLRDHLQAVNHSDFQQQPIARMAHASTALDSRLKQHFEAFGSNGLDTSRTISETRDQSQAINRVSSAKQSRTSDINRAVTAGTKHCRDDAHFVQGQRQVSERNHNLRTPQENHNITSDTLQQTNYVYGHQRPERFRGTEYTLRNGRENSSRKVTESAKEGGGVEETARPGCRVTGQCNIGVVTDERRIPATADVLKRPISPEFTALPNSKSNSLLKLVLSKSLLNYSPQDFERMRAASAETCDDSDSEDDEDDDTDLCSTSCESSLAGSGSAIFQRYWEGGHSDDSELGPYGTSADSSSFSRSSGSDTSASSAFADSPPASYDCTG